MMNFENLSPRMSHARVVRKLTMRVGGTNTIRLPNMLRVINHEFDGTKFHIWYETEEFTVGDSNYVFNFCSTNKTIPPGFAHVFSFSTGVGGGKQRFDWHLYAMVIPGDTIDGETLAIES